jgi:hypothetical protein
MARDEKAPAKAKTRQEVSISSQAQRRGYLLRRRVWRLHVILHYGEGKICAIVQSSGKELSARFDSGLK